MIQDKIFFDEKDPTGLSYNTPFTYYGSYQGRLWSKSPGGEIKYYTQNSDLSVYATTGSNSFDGNQTVTGSLTVTGTITGTVAGTTATASYVEYTNVANKPALISGSSQVTYSGLTGIPSGIVSGSAQVASFGIFATTGSNGFNGSQSITGSLTVTGQVVAQTLNVQQVTSSIVYSSGSNVFGNSLANTQQFTGSVGVTGSLTLDGGDLQLRGTATVQGNTFAPIEFYNSGNNATSIRPIRYNDETAADLTFWTRAYLGSITERMRIAYDGNVGIGVGSLLSPGGSRRLLQISNSTNGGIIALGSSTTESNNPRIFSGQFDLGFAAGVTTGNIDFYTNDQLRLTIASTGAATFSGALNGTSASFSGNVAAQGFQMNGTGGYGVLAKADGNNSAANGAYIGFVNNASSRYFISQLDTNNDINYYYFNGSTWSSSLIKLTNTGAAIFSTSAAVGGLSLSSTYASKLGLYNSSGSANMELGNAINTNGSIVSRLVSTNVNNGNSGNESSANFMGVASIETQLVSTSGNASGTSGANILFLTKADGGTLAERLRITADGNFLVGATNADIGGSVKGAIIRQDGSIVSARNISSPAHYQSPISSDRMNTMGDGLMYSMWRQGIFQAGIGATNASVMTFFTGNNVSMTERMRITSGGYLKASDDGTYVTATGPFHEMSTSSGGSDILLLRNSTSGTPYGLEIDFSVATPNNSTSWFFYGQDATAVRFIVYSNGNVQNTNNSYGALSDIKLKENITDATPKLDDLMKVKVRNYNLIGEDKKQIGVIAQELEEIFPAMIDESPDRNKDEIDLGTTTKSVKYSVFVPILIKAIQELSSKVETLEAEIQTLKQ